MGHIIAAFGHDDPQAAAVSPAQNSHVKLRSRAFAVSGERVRHGSVGQLLFATYWMFSPAIGYRRKMWAVPAASFPAVAVNLALNATLVPRFAGTGAAIALVASGAVQLTLFGYLSQRFFPIPPLQQ